MPSIFYSWGQVEFDDLGQRDSTAAGLLLVTRIRPRLSLTDRAYVHGDLGIGLVLSPEPFPVRGTHWNFSPQAGLGVGFFVSAKRAVEFDIRRVHISNGRDRVRGVVRSIICAGSGR